MKRASLVLCLLLPATSVGGTLHVPGDYPNIQSAINAAVDGDTVLVGPGLWAGPISFVGKEIVVRSSGGYAVTDIHTFSDFSVVYFTNGEGPGAVLEGFTVTHELPNGETYQRGPLENEPVIYVEGSSPVIRGNRIQDRDSPPGWCTGLRCRYSSALIEGNTIRFCGISISIVEGCDITILGNVVTQNSHHNVTGGIYCDGSTISVLGNVIAENEADGAGGGLRIDGCIGTVAGNLIEGNYSYGLGASNSILDICNNVISGNEGTGCGIWGSFAGIFVNNTICFNVDSYGAGGLAAACSSLTISNCVFWGNEAPFASQLWFGGGCIAHVEYCDVQYGEDSVYVEPHATLIWGPGNIDEDPLFEPGPLSDYQLSLSSPCVDAGNPDPICNDPEDPLNPGYALYPALGYLRNDMGAYGGGGVGYWLGVEEEAEPPSPEPGIILRAFPNPFRGSVTMVFELAEPTHANLRVYDLSARLIETPFDGEAPLGPMSCWLDGSRLPAGVYLARLQAGGLAATVRLVKL